MDKEKSDDLCIFMQMLFGLDHTTPINRRHDYTQNFFFNYKWMSDFCLSVWHQMMTKQNFVSDKQFEVISKFIRENYTDIINSFHNNVSPPMILARVGWGRIEGQKIATDYYNKEDKQKDDERKKDVAQRMKRFEPKCKGCEKIQAEIDMGNDGVWTCPDCGREYEEGT